MKQVRVPKKEVESVKADNKDGGDRKSEIRDKALAIFRKFGYRKTTIEDIGRACGLGKAALYHYFRNKEEILTAVLQNEGQRLLEQIQLAVDACEEPKDKLVAMVKARFRFIKDFIIGSNIVADEIRELLPLAENARQEFFQKEIRILQEILDEGWRKGVFKKLDEHYVPLLILSAFKGVENHFAEVQDAPALEEGVDEMLKLFLEGICV